MNRAISRRKFLKTSLAGALTTALMGGNCMKTSSRPSKPNLLFIWTDEQRADTMAAYGNHKIHTPNLNRLAEESFVFERAYVTQPVCTPSRSSVMTGLWPHQTGCVKNNVPLPLNIPCLPELLNDPSYRTAYMGKWHLGDEIFPQHGFQEWVSIEDGYFHYYRPERNKNARSDYYHFLLKNGYQPDLGDRFSRKFAARLPIEYGKPKFLEKKACEFLRRNVNQPFILYINFLEPHMPFFGPLDNEHDPYEIDLPGNFADPLDETEPLRYRVNRERHQVVYGPSEKKYRQLIARYYGLVSLVDRCVGNILHTLEELGLKENTIVVYTSDHGDMMGSHHMVEKSVMFEEAVRVPLILRVPWLKPYIRNVHGAVSHIDLVPTLLELMGCKKYYKLPGKSLVHLLKSNQDAMDDVFIEWNPDSGALKIKKGGTKLASQEELEKVRNEHSRAVITPDGWKLCLSDVEKCLLYNLKDDPGETTNLFYTGNYDDIIRRLSKKIRDWQIRVHDPVELKMI